MIEFKMPSLGADMAAATLMTWGVKPGDSVKRGDVIAEVETDKGLIEIEVFQDGTIDELTAQIGDKLPVGAVLAKIRESGEKPAAPATKPPSPEKHVRVSPLARKIAAELGVDLNTITGTGPGGAIEKADVERAASKATPPAPAEPVSAMRRAIAAAMAKSNREIPHYHLATRIDMTRPMKWLEAENARLPIQQRLLPAALLLKAVACALKQHPDLNGHWKDEQLVRIDAVHINFSIATRQGGLITPAIHDVDGKSPAEIMAALHDLIPRAKEGHLRSSELSEGTITVTSLGDLGVESVFGVIYPPQVAIVGFGSISEQAWAENGMLGVRPVLQATLAGDHRATDGRTGARFLDSLNRHFQQPESL